MAIEYNEQYASIRMSRLSMKERVVFKVKFTEPKTRVIAGGTSAKTGKTYDSFKSHSLLVEVPHKTNSRDAEYPNDWFLNYTSNRISNQIAEFEVGDIVTLTKEENNSKLVFVVRKTTEEDYAIILKEMVPEVSRDTPAQDITDTLRDMGYEGVDGAEVQRYL